MSYDELVRTGFFVSLTYIIGWYVLVIGFVVIQYRKKNQMPLMKGSSKKVMSKRTITGLILLGVFLGIIVLDILLALNHYMTFSVWMVRAGDEWPFAIVGGTSFFWGLLTGHWTWPIKKYVPVRSTKTRK